MTNTNCILVSTCDRYAPLARVTGRLIERYWPQHPPIVFYGATRPPDANWLESGAEQADWGGLLQAALAQLRARGFTRTYIVLDDHPPFGPCNSGHLNRTLPGFMDRLDAACIGLCGWDQGHSARGSLLGRGYHGLQHQAADFRWKFSLHPALWNVAMLSSMLEHLRARCRSPWEYERNLGSDPGIAERWGAHTYRICGWRLAATAHPRARHLARLARRQFLRALHGAGHALGARLAQGVDQALAHDREYFAGPYPMYWSGVLRQGRLHEEALEFLARRVDPAAAAEIRAQFAPPAANHQGGSR